MYPDPTCPKKSNLASFLIQISLGFNARTCASALMSVEVLVIPPELPTEEVEAGEVRPEEDAELEGDNVGLAGVESGLGETHLTLKRLITGGRTSVYFSDTRLGSLG